MRARHQALTALTALAVMAGFAVPAFSGATFTSSSTSSATVQAASDWTPPTTQVMGPAGFEPFGDEGWVLQGTVPLRATASDGESDISSLTIEVRRAGAGPWTSVCTEAGSSADCAWDTTRVTDGTYEVHSRATDGAGYSATSPIARATVRNNLTVTLVSPEPFVRGTVQLPATVAGTGGTAYPVQILRRGAGQSWTLACAGTDCTWDTAGLPTGTYELMARVVVNEQVLAVSPVVSTTVDNTGPQVAMQDPGARLSGSVTFTATATDGHSGVESVQIQYLRSGESTYRELCTVTAPPFSCVVDTRTFANGTYAFRALAVDRVGNEAVANPVEGRLVNNSPFSAVDIQAENGGQPGLVDAGDTITYTFNQPVAFDSVLPGWNGATRAVDVVLGPGRDNDDNTVEVHLTNLGTVHLNQNYLPGGGKSLKFKGQMSASALADGGMQIRVALTTTDTHPSQRSLGAGNLTWVPSAQLRSAVGTAITLPSAGFVLETGPQDVDF